MAGREDQAQQVVVERVVDRRGQVGVLVLAAALELEPQLLRLAVVHAGAPQPVDRPVLGGGHEPGARVVRDARLGPLLERGDERLLGEVLGEADVAHDPRDAGDQPCRLDPPDAVEGAPDVAHGAAYSPASTRWRSSSPLARSSGVSSSPKSSASKTGRISTIASVPGMGSGTRLTHSIASSSDLTCQTQ